ncbi:MAG: hypothetical protein CL959_05270 [Euryarchaeota archaeon]|nr:hypothetical protein [Euryarchaeota archaeon]|tara:strand:+ start:535 stop:894 length:360 start_codon:yes stop_codon:yes gene_type:complete
MKQLKTQMHVFTWHVTPYAAHRSMIDFHERNVPAFIAMTGINPRTQPNGWEHTMVGMGSFRGNHPVAWETARVKVYKTRGRGDLRVNINVAGSSFRQFVLKRQSTVLFTFSGVSVDDEK